MEEGRSPQQFRRIIQRYPHLSSGETKPRPNPTVAMPKISECDRPCRMMRRMHGPGCERVDVGNRKLSEVFQRRSGYPNGVEVGRSCQPHDDGKV
jgi:hypothetical protein